MLKPKAMTVDQNKLSYFKFGLSLSCNLRLYRAFVRAAQ